MSDDESNVALLDALRRANPVTLDDVAGRRELPSAHKLFAEITAQQPRRVRRRTLIVAIALIVLAIASVLGASALVDRTDDPNPAQPPKCYEKADRSSLSIVTSGADLAEACASLWRTGEFSGPVPKSFDRCLLETGAVAVFPGESGSVCDKLGLRSVQPSSYAERVRKATLEAADALAPPHCFDYDDAFAIIRGALDKYDLRDWTITAGGHRISAKEPCASTAPDTPAKTVLIQAMPDFTVPVP